MNIPAWAVTTYPSVRCTRRRLSNIVDQMKGVDITAYVQPGGLSVGRIVFFTLEPHPVAIAWEWAEVRHGVIAISDPMSVLANVEFISDDGVPLDEAMFAVYLNSAIYRLNWQSVVAAHLQAINPLPMAA